MDDYNMFGSDMEQNHQEADALGNYANDKPLNEYGFPCCFKENGKIDKSQSVCYLPIPLGFEYNVEWLKALGFNDNEISVYTEVLFLIGRLSERRLRSRMNLSTMKSYYTNSDISILMYMYNFCVKSSDSSLLSSLKFLSNHYNKLYNLRNADNPNAYKGSVAQVTKRAFMSIARKFDKFPRRVEIQGIDDEAFGIYNSSNYVKYDKLYSLADGTNVGSEYVTVITDKVPLLKFRSKKGIDDVCSVSLSDDDVLGNEALYELKINRDYVVFKPTYYIYITTKMEPGVNIEGQLYNLSYYRIIGESGMVLTVAIGVHQLGKHERNKISASENVQEIAYYPDEASIKLKKVVKEVYAKVHGIKVIPVKGNCNLSDFLEYSKHLTVEERQELEYEKMLREEES